MVGFAACRYLKSFRLCVTTARPSAQTPASTASSPGADNTWVAATDSRDALDAWEGLAQILHDPLEQLHPFGAAHGREEFFSLLQEGHDWFLILKCCSKLS